MGTGGEDIPIPQPIDPAGISTTPPPAPVVNCSGRVLNGTSCPDEGSSSMLLYIIIAAVGAAVVIALIAVLVYFLVKRKRDAAAKNKGYVPVPDKPGDKPSVKPTVKPGEVPAKVISVSLVTRVHPPGWCEEGWGCR